MTLSLSDARRVIAAGERRARELSQPMNIAVVDDGGNLVSHVRMDGAWVGSVDVSINKAVTAHAGRPRPAEERVRDLAAASVSRYGGPDHAANGHHADRYPSDGLRADHPDAGGRRGSGHDPSGHDGHDEGGYDRDRYDEDRYDRGGYRESGYRESGYRGGAGRGHAADDDRFGDVSGRGRAARPVGGVPLTRDGRVVGAVGVSGGTADDDQTVARAAAAAL
nr:heme-binding protein [Pseudofrankia asymbiotica]